MILTEKQLVYVIIEYLRLSGHFVWRNNSGYMFADYTDKSGTTRKRGIKIGMKGSSDIIGVHKDGRFIAIECKIGKNKTTPAQDYFLEEIKRHGGIALIAYDLDDVEREL